MAVDLDTQVKLADFRLRVLNGEELTPLEYRDLFLDLARGRDMAAAASATERKRAKAAASGSKVRQPTDIRALFSTTQCIPADGNNPSTEE